MAWLIYQRETSNGSWSGGGKASRQQAGKRKNIFSVSINIMKKERRGVSEEKKRSLFISEGRRRQKNSVAVRQ